jgi:hypothetical protein
MSSPHRQYIHVMLEQHSFIMDANIVDNHEEDDENEQRDSKSQGIAAVVAAETKRIDSFYPKGRLLLITFIKQYNNFLLLTRLKCDELIEDFVEEMGDDIRRMSRYFVEIEPVDVIKTRRLQLLAFLERYDDFLKLTRGKCDEFVVTFFDEMISNTSEMIFDDAIGHDYRGLDIDYDTDEELEATLRFFPCVMYLPRFTRNKMPLLIFLKKEEDDEEDNEKGDVLVCNRKAVSFLPIVLRVAVELGVKEPHERGGLLSHTYNDISIMDRLMMSGTEYSKTEYLESIDEQFLQVLKQLRVLHLLRKEDIKKYGLLRQLCCQPYFAQKRFLFLVEWDPNALTQTDQRDWRNKQGWLPLHFAALQSTIIGFRSVLDMAIRYFPCKKGISLLFLKDYKNDWPLTIACDEHRFGRVKSMKAIEASMTIYSSTTLEDKSEITSPILNIVEAIIYAAINVNIHLDCVYFLLRRQPDIISGSSSYNIRNNIVSNDDDIANLLERDAIGYGAEKAEMERYAENLIKIEGYHSVEFIKKHCEDWEVGEWSWMKPMHRKAFKKWLSRTKAIRNKAIRNTNYS